MKPPLDQQWGGQGASSVDKLTNQKWVWCRALRMGCDLGCVMRCVEDANGAEVQGWGRRVGAWALARGPLLNAATWPGVRTHDAGRRRMSGDKGGPWLGEALLQEG